MGEFDLKTDFKTPSSGSMVLCWDTMFLRDKNPNDKLSCHGKVGMVVRKASPADLDAAGSPLGVRAEGCWTVLFPSESRPMVVHGQWLKVMDAEA